MNRFISPILRAGALLAALPFLAGAAAESPAPGPAAAPANDTGKWLCPEAEYRLRVLPEKNDAAGSVDLRRLLLPAPADNGVRVFDSAGKPVPNRLFDNDMLITAPSPETRYLDLYFGFKTPQERDQWAGSSVPLPAPDRLTLHFYSGFHPCTPDEFLEQRNEWIARGIRWQPGNFAFRAFNLDMQEAFGHEIPPWLPRPRNFLSNRSNLRKNLLSRNNNQRRRTLWELYIQPDTRELDSMNSQAKWQFRGHLINIRRENDKTALAYATVKADAKDGVLKDLLHLPDTRRWKKELTATELQMLVRPPETSEFYSARFFGQLQIPADGEYEFELYSNSLTVVRIDGEEAQRHIGNGSAPAETLLFKRKLSAGSHFLELFYRINSGVGRLTLRMRNVAGGDFQLLNAEEFAPAPPGRPRELVSRDGKRYPLVMRRNHFLFHTGKQERSELEEFRFLTPVEELDYRRGDLSGKATDLPPVLVLPHDEESGLEFHFRTAPEIKLPVHPEKYAEDRIPLYPDLRIDLWLPRFLYDDETLEGAVETGSRLPVAIDAELSIRPEQFNSSFPERLIPVTLPAKADERFDRFSQDVIRKFPLPLPGGGVERSLELTFQLSVFGFEFDRKEVKFLRAADAKNLVATPEGIFDREGRRIVLLLHRPTLAELRNWELPRKINNELHPTRKILVIAPDFGSGENRFGFRVEENLKQRGFAASFLSWRNDENPLMNTLPELFDAIESQNADTVLLVTPDLQALSAVESWERDRALAALIEKLRSNPALRHLKLAVFPAASDEDGDREREVLDSLRRLAREYDVDVLDIASGLRATLPEDGSAFKPENSTGEQSRYPVSRAAELAESFSARLP